MWPQIISWSSACDRLCWKLNDCVLPKTCQCVWVGEWMSEEMSTTASVCNTSCFRFLLLRLFIPGFVSISPICFPHSAAGSNIQARGCMRIQRCVKFIDNPMLSTWQTDGSPNLSDRHCLLRSDLIWWMRCLCVCVCDFHCWTHPVPAVHVHVVLWLIVYLTYVMLQ